MQKALDFRTSLIEAEQCRFTAQIAANYPQRIFEFTLDVVWTPKQTTLTVVEPAEICGISATVSEDGTSIQFEDVELDFGKLANGYISPVCTPWLLGQCWVGEYISAAGNDAELTKVSYLRGYHEAQLAVDTWLTQQGIPVHAEVFYDDEKCLTVEIQDFQMT